MPKKIRKRTSLAKLNFEQRKQNARKWLQNPHYRIKDHILAYCKRYKVSHSDAYWELIELGFKDIITIEAYEKEGIEWEYKHDGYTGEDLVVPKGTPDWELHLYY